MMSLGEILFVYRARMRERAVLVQEVVAIIGITVGVALLFASQVASTSLDGSVRALASQLVGSTQFQLDSRSNEGFDGRLAGEVERLPGIDAALPLLDQQATITGPSGSAAINLLGADPRLVRSVGELLRRFTAKQLEHQRVLALPAPIAARIGAGPLQVVKLQVGARVTETLIGTTLGESDIGGLANSQIALAPISYAQALAGMPGRISRLYIRVRPGHEAQARVSLAALASKEHLNFLPADFDAQLFSVASAPAQQAEGLFSVLSAFVGFLLAFNAMLLTVPERKKLIEAMRRRGTTRTMTVQLLSFDALVIGVFAGALGIGFGELLSTHVYRAQPGYLAFAFPVGTERIVTWETIALAGGTGMVAAFVGVLTPMRAILARPLRSSVASERPLRGWASLRLTLGVICLAITTSSLFRHPYAGLARNYTFIIVTMCVALMCLLPFLYKALLTVFSSIDRRFGVSSTRLALIELDDPLTRIRSLAVAATGAIAVFGSVAMQGAEHNLQAGLDRATVEWNRVTDLWVSPAGTANTLGTTPFPSPSSTASRLKRLPTVQAVNIYRGGFLTLGDRRLWIIAPPRAITAPMPHGQLVSGTPALVNMRLRGHGWAVISEAVANELHLHLGSTFTLPSPVPIHFRVAGLSTNGGWPPGVVIINADDYARAWGSPAASALQVSLRPGVSLDRGRSEAQRILGPNSGLSVQTAGEREQQWKTGSRQGLAQLTQIATLVLIAAVLAMAGVMSSMILQRRDQLAYIKRQGFTRGLLWRSVFIQSAILLGAGCLIGAAFGIYGQLVISHALATVTGFPIVIGTRTAVALGSSAVVSAAALAIVAIPGYLAVRVRASTVSPV
jgi:putative ABC transport system permease protein